MPETTTVHVSNISPATTPQELRDFFSFCGKISKLSLSPTSADPGAPQSATVTFERSSAAKTALLLDQTRLGGNNVHVEAAHTLDEIAGGRTTSANEDEPTFGADTDPTYAGEQGPRQEDKPKSAILAEYLSAGYAVGDTALQKGIELDQKAGISTRFTSFLQSLDAKFHAIEKAKNYDAQYRVTDKLKETQNTLTHYFETALNTPTGKKIRDFYATGAKQVVDIHNEAKRLAELKKQSAQEKSACTCAANEGNVCSCPPGKCECAGCQKKREEVPLAEAGAA
ncbi:putative actin cytoskeleton protein [Terfezia claveryi]|nr:putative actin cytoskeleton protein [Terfezia claveryi]